MNRIDGLAFAPSDGGEWNSDTTKPLPLTDEPGLNGPPCRYLEDWEYTREEFYEIIQIFNVGLGGAIEVEEKDGEIITRVNGERVRIYPTALHPEVRERRIKLLSSLRGKSESENDGDNCPF